MASFCASQLLNRLYRTCRVIHKETNHRMPVINVNVHTPIEIEHEINKCFNYIERPYYSYLKYDLKYDTIHDIPHKTISENYESNKNNGPENNNNYHELLIIAAGVGAAATINSDG